MDRASYMLWYNFIMFNLDEEKTEVMSRDLTPAMREKASKPKKTWFFKRLGDGRVIATEEREAWQICYNRSTWKRRDFQLIGTSDGSTFYRITRESIVEAQQLEPEIEKKKAELEKFMKREEDLILDEVVDMEGDPADEENERNKQKVLRLRKIIDDLHETLDTLEARYKDLVADVVQRATNAEMEVAIKNQAKRLADGLDVDWPDQNLNIQTPEAKAGGRQKILGLIGGRV